MYQITIMDLVNLLFPLSGIYFDFYIPYIVFSFVNPYNPFYLMCLEK